MARNLIYGVEDIPPWRETIFLGFQHYLTMFGATVAIPLILAEPLGMGGDVVQVGAALMVVLATFGKFGALFATILRPIVGGMYCTMFGMIVSVGLSNLQFVNLNSARNLFILGFSLFMGLSLPEYFAANPVASDPAWMADLVNTLGRTGMAVGAMTALVLDNTIPGTDEERGLKAWQQQDRDQSTTTRE